MLISARIKHALAPTDWALVQEALQTLADNDLADVAETVCRVVLAPECLDRVCEANYGGLRPYAELLFHDLRWVATAPGWLLETRRQRAQMALICVGFDEGEML